MDEKLFNALKTKYSNLGLSDKVIKGVATSLATTTTEENLEAVVTSAENMLKSFQSDFDVLRGENSKLKSDFANAAQQAQQQQAQQQQSQNTQAKKDEKNDAIEALMKEISELKANQQSFEARDRNERLLGSIKSKLEAEKIPQSFYGASISGRQFESEEQASEFIQSITTSFKEFQETMVSEGLMKAHIPASSQANPNQTSTWVKSYTEKQDATQGKPIVVVKN